MANTNPEIMKRYKSSIINRMSFKQLIKIYAENNIKFEKDISRLLEFNNSKEKSICKIYSDSKHEPIHKIKLINLYSSILSNLISKKYPYIKKDSIIYTILNTTFI
jgi:hypothetical protein